MNADPRRRLRRARRRLSYRLRIAVRAHHAPTRVTDPVFVLSGGRVGSYLLIDYLNSLPGAAFRGEILNPETVIGLRKRWRSKQRVLRHLRHSVDSLDEPVRGAKLIFSQIQNHGLDLEDLRRVFPDVRFIVLYRRAMAAGYVSKLIALRTGAWKARDDSLVSQDTVRVDPDDASAFFERIKADYRAALAPQWVRDRALVVCYEDLVADPQREFSSRVCPFLGIAPSPVSTRMVKQNRRPLHEVIENYAAVEAILTGEASRHDYAL